MLLDKDGSGAPFPAKGRKATGAALTEMVGSDGTSASDAIVAVKALMSAAGPATATIGYSPAAQESNAINVVDHQMGGFTVVAAPSAGYVSLKVSRDGGTNYGTLFVDGSQVIIAVAAGKDYGIGNYFSSMMGVTHIKFVNVNSSGVAQNQSAADATIIVGRA